MVKPSGELVEVRGAVNPFEYFFEFGFEIGQGLAVVFWWVGSARAVKTCPMRGSHVSVSSRDNRVT